MSATAARRSRQAGIGLSLAAAIVLAFLGLHVYGVFLFRFDLASAPLVPVIVLAQCWLGVGLFIVAHDGMHGSLAPGRPALNRAVGRLCLILYAGFSYDRLLVAHHAHHRHAGTADDPDFHAGAPRRFWPWFGVFFRRYVGWPDLARLAAFATAYVVVLGVAPANLLVFWALPALLSALQLFVFGTFLPHRHEDEPFGDRHNARSSGYSWPVSLLTCFHFGYHHEHHEQPQVPWWGLPGLRAGRPQDGAGRT